MRSGGVILLAAGFSRRFGADKRRHALVDGMPLLDKSVDLYTAAFTRTIVVLRPGDDDLAAAVRARHGDRARVVFCRDAHLGMGHSLACGAGAAAGWDYAFVALADMAWVQPATLARLRQVMEADPSAIVLAVHDGRAGHPVGFSGALLGELQTLTGDEGARSVLRNHQARLRRVEVDDPGVLQDLDVPPGVGAGSRPRSRPGGRSHKL